MAENDSMSILVAEKQNSDGCAAARIFTPVHEERSGTAGARSGTPLVRSLDPDPQELRGPGTLQRKEADSMPGRRLMLGPPDIPRMFPLP